MVVVGVVRTISTTTSSSSSKQQYKDNNDEIKLMTNTGEKLVGVTITQLVELNYDKLNAKIFSVKSE